MELTILGCSGSYPTAETECSGYLLREDGYAVWMDAGNGTLGRLQQHIKVDELDGVVLSHAHPDHCADLYPFFYAILFAERPAPVPILAPPGVREKLESLVGADSIERFRTLLDWCVLEPGGVAELGPMRFRAFDAVHSTRNNTLRVEAGGRTLCYSGDTGPNPDLSRAAAAADVFLCEASWLDEQKGIMGPIHLTAGEAGAAARDAGCARLILTHLWPSNDPERARSQAQNSIGGRAELALETSTTSV